MSEEDTQTNNGADLMSDFMQTQAAEQGNNDKKSNEPKPKEKTAALFSTAAFPIDCISRHFYALCFFLPRQEQAQQQGNHEHACHRIAVENVPDYLGEGSKEVC